MNAAGLLPDWVQVSRGVHSLNCALDCMQQRDQPMGADETPTRPNSNPTPTPTPTLEPNQVRTRRPCSMGFWSV